MIPYLLAVAGGYLIGNSMNETSQFTYAEGGMMAKGGWVIGETIYGGRMNYFLYNEKSGVRRGLFNTKKQAEKELERLINADGGMMAKGGYFDEYYTSKEVIEQALRDENIKFQESPIYYDSSSPRGDNDEIEKINLYIPNGGIYIYFKNTSEVTISQLSTGDEKDFDLDTPPKPIGNIIQYIKQLQTQ
jgi:hypothetical protein